MCVCVCVCVCVCEGRKEGEIEEYVSIILMYSLLSQADSLHQFAGTTSTGGSSFSYPLPPTSTGIPPHQPTVPTSVTNPYHHTAMSSQHQPVSIFQPAPVDSSAPPTGYTGSQVMAPEVHSAYFVTQPQPVVPTPPQSRKNGVCVCGGGGGGGGGGGAAGIVCYGGIV